MWSFFHGATLCAQEFKWRELEEQRKAERLQRQLQQEQAFLLSLQHGPKQRKSSLTAQTPDWAKLPQARPLDGPEPSVYPNTDECTATADRPSQTDSDESANPDAGQSKHVDGNEAVTDECREETESASVDSNPLVTQPAGEADSTDYPLVQSTPSSDPASEAQPVGEVKSSVPLGPPTVACCYSGFSS